MMRLKNKTECACAVLHAIKCLCSPSRPRVCLPLALSPPLCSSGDMFMCIYIYIYIPPYSDFILPYNRTLTPVSSI
jgi:hypothetical protein